MKRKKLIQEAIQRLNCLYGRGEVTYFNWVNDNWIFVTVQKQYGSETFNARIVNNTVFARNHQQTIKEG